MPRQGHSLLREGLVAGGLGAAAVAVWFLITDFAQGRPLSTPSILGQVVLFGITDPAVSPVQTGPLIAYTLLHVGAFILFGIAVTHLFHLAMTSALARFALVAVGVVFELFFFMLTFMLFAGTSYLFPWWSVLVANTLALLAMGYYLVGRHQGLRHSFRQEPLGAEEGTR
ncbi:MAG: hypothetical protein HOP28_17855 [Gemmatimonadales bacterium]|nr:hypothetical protein [Gemmatimonadales bacterium]